MAYRLRAAGRAITRQYDDAMREVDLRSTQFTILTVLAFAETVTMAELAGLLAMERTTLYRNLRPLARRGLVQLEGEGRPQPTTITLSEAGAAKLHQAIPFWEKVQKKVKQKIGDLRFEQTLFALKVSQSFKGASLSRRDSKQCAYTHYST